MVKFEMPQMMGAFVLFLTWRIIINLADGHSLFTCEPIDIQRCSGMTYNMTFFPNLMGHYDQHIADVHLKVSFFVSLICLFVR